MKNYAILIMIFLSSLCSADENWQQHWENGRKFLSNQNCEEAAFEFDSAVAIMSENELEQFPYVLMDRIECEYSLKNYPKVLEDTDKALSSQHLTDHERLECGMKRIAVFMQLDQEDFAVEEYKKHIIGCSLFPKYNKFEDKIVIRNLPDCECYQNSAKQLMVSKYCQDENDIQMYGNMWIVNITKRNNSMKNQSHAVHVKKKNLNVHTH